MELKEFYKEIGADADVVIKRMGLTEKHLKKYLRKFMDNQEYKKLSKAVAEQDYYNVEWAAHTIKGVTANLGLTILFDDFQKIVDSVRNEKNKDIDRLYQDASVDYEHVMNLLAKVDLDEQQEK